MDLNDMRIVKDFAIWFKSTFDRLDILLNNAGIYYSLGYNEVTIQKIEKIIGVNHYGHFLLTNLLLDVIKKTPESRIVNVASFVHTGGNLDYVITKTKTGVGNKDSYSASKLCNILFTKYLANTLKEEGHSNVKICTLHPGVCRTNIFDLSLPFVFLIHYFYPIWHLFTKSSS